VLSVFSVFLFFSIPFVLLFNEVNLRGDENNCYFLSNKYKKVLDKDVEIDNIVKDGDCYIKISPKNGESGKTHWVSEDEANDFMDEKLH